MFLFHFLCWILWKIIRKAIEESFAMVGSFYGKNYRKIGLKAPRKYSGPFRAYNFSICLWERPKPIISMTSGSLNVSLIPKPTNSISWDPRRPQLIQDKSPHRFPKTIFCINCNLFRKSPFWNLWKRRTLTNYEDTSSFLFENLEYGINIFQRTWNGKLVNLWNFETKKLWNHETKKPRNFETKKPRIFETKKPRN